VTFGARGTTQIAAPRRIQNPCARRDGPLSCMDGPFAAIRRRIPAVGGSRTLRSVVRAPATRTPEPHAPNGRRPATRLRAHLPRCTELSGIAANHILIGPTHRRPESPGLRVGPATAVHAQTPGRFGLGQCCHTNEAEGGHSLPGCIREGERSRHAAYQPYVVMYLLRRSLEATPARISGAARPTAGTTNRRGKGRPFLAFGFPIFRNPERAEIPGESL
jgi:hypothetical protein